MTRYTARTAPRPAGDGWRRLPSVTYGGAPAFWHRRTSSALEWFAYDRIMRAWRHTREPFAASEPVTHAYASPAARETRRKNA